MLGVRDLLRSRFSAVRRSRPNRRMDRQEPSSVKGETMAFTREPSARRASTMGEDSSTRRPTAETIRSMIRRRCASSRNCAIRALEFAVPFHEHVAVRIHENIGDRSDPSAMAPAGPGRRPRPATPASVAPVPPWTSAVVSPLTSDSIVRVRSRRTISRSMICIRSRLIF